VIIACTVLIQYSNVTDRWTDALQAMAKTRARHFAIARKNGLMAARSGCRERLTLMINRSVSLRSMYPLMSAWAMTWIRRRQNNIDSRHAFITRGSTSCSGGSGNPAISLCNTLSTSRHYFANCFDDNLYSHQSKCME